MKPGEIVSGSEQCQGYWQSQKIENHWCVLAKRVLNTGDVRLAGIVSIWAAPKEIKIKRRGDQQLGSVSKSQSEECAGNERRRTHQRKVESGGFSEQSETQSDLPGAGHSKIAPRPRSKNWKERQQNPA